MRLPGVFWAALVSAGAAALLGARGGPLALATRTTARTPP